MLLAVVETTVYVDFVLLYGGPSLREGQRPEFDTWLDNLLDVGRWLVSTFLVHCYSTKANDIFLAECKRQEEYNNEDNMWEHGPIKEYNTEKVISASRFGN